MKGPIYSFGFSKIYNSVDNLGYVDDDDTGLNTILDRFNDNSNLEKYYRKFNSVFMYSHFSNEVIELDPLLFKITDETNLDDLVYRYMENHRIFLYSVYKYIISEMQERKIYKLKNSSLSNENGVHAWSNMFKDFYFEYNSDIKIIIKFISLYDLDERDGYGNDCMYYLSKMKIWPMIRDKLKYYKAIRYNDLAKREDLNDEAGDCVDSMKVPIECCYTDALEKIIREFSDNPDIQLKDDPIEIGFKHLNDKYLEKYYSTYSNPQQK